MDERRLRARAEPALPSGSDQCSEQFAVMWWIRYTSLSTSIFAWPSLIAFSRYVLVSEVTSFYPQLSVRLKGSEALPSRMHRCLAEKYTASPSEHRAYSLPEALYWEPGFSLQGSGPVQMRPRWAYRTVEPLLHHRLRVLRLLNRFVAQGERMKKKFCKF